VCSQLRLPRLVVRPQKQTMNRRRAHFPVRASVTDTRENMWHSTLDVPVRAASAKIGRPYCFDEGFYSATVHLIAPEGFMPPLDAASGCRGPFVPRLPATPTRARTPSSKKSHCPLALKLILLSSGIRSSVNLPICSAKSALADASPTPFLWCGSSLNDKALHDAI
jgi:hypothetical protein